MDELEENWDISRTPSRLKTSFEIIKECYQNAKVNLSSFESHQIPEYNQLMFYHHYNLAIHMNNSYFLNKLDLDTTLMFLNCCLKDYENIPEDYRDCSIDDSYSHVNELQQEVSIKIDKLSKSLSDVKNKEFVETCLALGKTDNNSEILAHLKTCSEEVKKNIGQLLRCTELVRLIISLEESSLIQTFKRLEIPVESETCLARAYHLAINGEPMKSCSENSKPVQKVDDDQVFYGNALERVRDIINIEVVHNKLNLEQVKICITRDIGKELSVTDAAFIEDEYREICLDQCLEEITKSMKGFIRSKGEMDIMNILDLIEKMTKSNDIPDYFKPLDYLKEVLKMSLNENEEFCIVQHFKKVCLEHIDDLCNTIKNELGLLSCLKSYLRSSRNVNSVVSKLGLTGNTSELDLKKILDFTDQENDEQLTELKCMVNEMQPGNKLVIEDKILETIRSFVEPPQIQSVKVDGREVIEVIGKHVVLSEVLESVENELAAKLNTSELRIIGEEAFHIDADLVNDIWHGTNVAVRSKIIVVHGTVEWDVSGKSNKHKYSPARSATIEGGDGMPGIDGFPGESGGNVLILTEQLKNSEEFTIISKGGDGSDGQDGGNGHKGQDGIGMSRQELEQSFKSPVKHAALPSKRHAEAQRITQSINQNFPYSSVYDIGHWEFFIEADNSKGQKIIFSFNHPGLFQGFSNCYFLCKGSSGKQGGKGGSYGRGGQGGFPGQISVKSAVIEKMFNVKKLSTRGQDGRDGVAGLYGNTGNNGWDIGYIDHQFWTDPVYYGGGGQLTVSYHNDKKEKCVRCWYKDKYASITPILTHHFQTILKIRQFEERELNQSAVAVMKKTITESSFNAKYDHHFNTVEKNVLFNMYDRIENIRKQIVDGSDEQRKKSSKRQQIQHMISKQNDEQNIDEPLATMPNTVKRNALKVTPLLNSKLNVDSLISWRQLKYSCIEKSDLIAKLNFIKSTNVKDDDLQNIKKNLINKYKLMIFEELADKINSDNIFYNKTLLASKYTPNCLEENPHQSGLICHDTLGTLDEYLYRFNHGEQQGKLIEFCRMKGNVFLSSVVQAFLLETELTDVDTSVQPYLDHYKQFVDLQQYDSIIILDQFMQVLIKSTHSKLLHLWYHANERSSLESKLKHEIDRDCHLGNLRARHESVLKKKFNWGHCLQDEKFLEIFRRSIVKNGPLTRSYRELLAVAFGINIQIYASDHCGNLSLLDSHNNGATEIVYLLLQNNSFYKLDLNENLMKLEENRRARARKYSKIVSFIMSLNEKGSIDDFMANFHHKNWDIPVLNDYDEICSGDLIDQLLKYFTSRERHTLKKLLIQSDVSSGRYNKLLRNILFRFDAEGNHISTDEILYLINQYIVACINGIHDETLVSWIILAFPQDNWIREVLLLHMEKYFKKSLEKKFEWRSHLTKVQNNSILILLSSKLRLNNPNNCLTIDKMDEILRLLYLNITKPEPFLKLDLSEWYYILQEIYWAEKLKKITKWKKDCPKLREASYYTESLHNNYGFKMLEQFFDKLEQHRATDIDIVNTLWNVYNGRCLLTDQNIDRLDKIGLQDWIKETKSQTKDNKERDISTLVQLIEDNNNASRNILQKLSSFKKDVQNTYEDGNIEQNNSQLSLQKPIFWLRNRFSDKSIVAKLKDIDNAIYEKLKFRLRDSQKLTILTLVKNDRSTLAQVATGEGKSLIVVAVAIIKASLGQKVDIITSSSVLARRDAEQSKSIFARFGINVSHNCSEDIDKRKKAYSNNEVVYGDLSSFQRDYLLHKFYQKNVLGDRNFENVIVDEVDSMLLDKGNNMLYLAHDLPDMDKLESVYVFLWQWVNNSSRKLETVFIKEAVLWQIYGVIKPADVGKLDAALNEEQRKFIWNKLVEVKIIDSEGKLMTDTTNKDILADMLGTEFSIYIDRLEFLLKECINREKVIHVPNYLRSFVDLHLESWIEAAKTALLMEPGQDYVVDVDRSGSRTDRTPNLTILDRDTGTDMVNSQWEAALHQFVQLKHGCKTYLQSLKAVFISNVKYFKLYKNLYGLSGTLGSHRERDLLKEIYSVDFVNIPTAKLKLFHENAPIVCMTATDWTNEIIKSARHMTIYQQRSVLIICETLNEVTELYKAFGGTQATNVRTYTREYEEFNIGELPQRQIIIATNLAGRGTDIKITSELKTAGGIHVCLTYLPTNIRVEQQAFGRAARCGDEGSGQLIVLDSNESRNVLQLKRERDTRELSRISQIKKHYETRIVQEEKCFSKFTEQYDELRKLLSTSDVTKRDEDLRDILLGSALDRWVFWLDGNEKNLITNAEDSSHKKLHSSLDRFLDDLKWLKAYNHESLMEWVDTSIPRMVKLGRFFVLNNRIDLAHKVFENVIAREPHFSEAARYYNAYALSTKINFKDVDSPEVKEFTQTLRSAANLFEERIQSLTSNVSLIDRIKTNFKDNILPITAYKEQKQIMCKFYGSLIKSVDDILGHPVSGTSFVVEDCVSKSMSVEIFNSFLAKKIVQNPTLKDNISEEELRGISYSYGIPAGKLKGFLKSCRQNQGRVVQFEEFVRLLKEQVKLPSREGFWQKLIEKKILINEVKYVVVDKTKLSYEDIQFLEAKVSRIRSETKLIVEEGEFLLYPDQLLEGKVYQKAFFKNAIDLEKYATYKEIGAICFQRKAYLNLDKIKLQEVNFQQYGSITLEDFAMLNISQHDSNEILDLLVRGKILQRQNATSEEFILRAPITKLKNINLSSYKIYEQDVRDLLNLCFCYKIAFDSITCNAKEKKMRDITLISKPHRRIVADLLCARIIEPAKISYSTELKDEVVMDALTGFMMDESRKDKVLKRLKSLKGCMNHLKMVSFPESDRYTNVEEWNIFSLNGNEQLLKLKGPGFFKIIGTFLWGALKIGIALVKNIKTIITTKQFRFDFSAFSDGWGYICSAFRMACDAYVSDYFKIKFNNLLKRVALFEAKYFGWFGTKIMKFAFEVSQPTTQNIQQVRRLAVPLIRGFDIASDTANIKFLIEERLQQMYNELYNSLLSTVEKSKTISGFGECLKKAVYTMGIDETKIKLTSTTETFLNRQTYLININSVFEKVVETILQSISKATKRLNVHNSIAAMLSGEINDATMAALEDNEPKLAEIIHKIVLDLTGSLTLAIKGESAVDQVSPTHCENFIEENTKNLKIQLCDKLNDLIKKTIRRPMIQRGSYLLLSYAERQIELQYCTQDYQSNPSEEFAKTLRVEQLKAEGEERRQAKAMTPTENLLDQQFNEALANWERRATELQRLAVQIRRGEPVDGRYLELCLDAVRFALLRRAVVISNISINLVTKNGTRETISSPRHSKGIALDLYLKDGKFNVEITDTTSPEIPSNNCLYDCLCKTIFELKSLTSKKFAREISQHLFNLSENKINIKSTPDNFLNFNEPSIFRELCFAQFLRACFTNPSKGVFLYRNLMERAENGKNCARDWHGTDSDGHVKVITINDSEQFVEASFRRNATTDISFGRIMTELREAFFNVYE